MIHPVCNKKSAVEKLSIFSSVLKNLQKNMDATAKIVRKFCKVNFFGDHMVPTIINSSDLNRQKLDQNTAINKITPIRVRKPREKICETDMAEKSFEKTPNREVKLFILKIWNHKCHKNY